MESIALVLDPCMGVRILEIAQRMPVWVLSTPENNLGVQKARLNGDCRPITLLLLRPHERLEDTLDRALFAIDEHCGEQSQEEPYNTLWVHGISGVPSVEATTELGFKTITLTSDGFMATKV